MARPKKKVDNQQDISKVPIQLQPHVFKKGQSGNLAGRPKGVTLKEYCRDFLTKMTDYERQEFMEGIPKEVIWKMAEGNPKQDAEMEAGENLQQLLVKIIGNDNGDTTRV